MLFSGLYAGALGSDIIYSANKFPYPININATSISISPQTETVLEWANVLPEDIAGAMCYCANNSDFFFRPLWWNCVFFSYNFWLFEENVYFKTWV